MLSEKPETLLPRKPEGEIVLRHTSTAFFFQSRHGRHGGAGVRYVFAETGVVSRQRMQTFRIPLQTTNPTTMGVLAALGELLC